MYEGKVFDGAGPREGCEAGKAEGRSHVHSMKVLVTVMKIMYIDWI